MDLTDAFSNMANMVNGKLTDKIDINKVMSQELNGVVDYGLWLETVDIQKSFNDKVAPGWQQDKEKYDFWMAILDETIEVLGSRHWKWWKKDKEVGDIDWDNIRVELVDLFHFILSVAIQNDSHAIIFQQLVNLEMHKDVDIEGYTPKLKDKDFFKDFWEQFLMSVQMKMLPLCAVRIVEYWYRSGGDVNELFMEYRIKAALNNIRQEFGYGTGYSKMWLDVTDGTKKEDNVIAWKLAQDIPLDGDTVSKIEEILRSYYLTHCSI